MTDKPIRAVVVGGTGYTGAELVRLIATHPALEIAALTADRRSPKSKRVRCFGRPSVGRFDGVEPRADR